jgi:predicted hotdog family 3-hydroxylacyl-ACP dehydratase
MTTAQLRTAAREAQARLDWTAAADLMEQAIAAYPRTGSMADHDKAKMRAFVIGCRAMEAA